jgi:hypothetical protein
MSARPVDSTDTVSIEALRTENQALRVENQLLKDERASQRPASSAARKAAPVLSSSLHVS